MPSSCPSAAECFTKSDQRWQSRELVLTELIARRVQRTLRVEHRQVIAGPFLVAKLGAFESPLALRNTFNLKFARIVQMPERPQGVLHVDQGRQNGGPVGGHQLLVLGLGLRANRPQP